MKHRKLPYDPVPFWTEEGRTYYDRHRRTEAFKEQEEALIDVLSVRLSTEDRLPLVLEAGCGFGRIADLLYSTFGDLYYLGFDLSYEQICRAQELVPMNRATFLRKTIDDFEEVEHGFDLVLAVEVLMHVKPEDLERTVDKLRSFGPLITVDWTEPVEGPIDNHNFLHDYEALGLRPIRKVGLQTIYSSEG